MADVRPPNTDEAPVARPSLAFQSKLARRAATAVALATALTLGLPTSDPGQAQSTRRNDAYRPTGEEGPGLGTLQAPAPEQPSRYEPQPSGQQTAQPYPPPSYSGAPYGAQQTPAYDAPQPYNPPYRAQRNNDQAQQGSTDAYRPGAPRSGGYAANNEGYATNNSGFGQPYSPPAAESQYGQGRRPYMSGDGQPPYRSDGPNEQRGDSTYSTDEISSAGHGFFGSISKGLASVIEHTYRKKGRPNGYILGEEAGGAFVAGLRYGQGRLYTKDAGSFPVYWQGPSLGFDVGAEGSKVMVLVYNLRDPRDVFERFGGIDGSAYVVGGVGVTFLSKDHVVMAPIRSGVGLRLGANVGYLKYTSKPTWNPF
jgi:hypothetical protein